jgi:L-cystine transport system permease protein
MKLIDLSYMPYYLSKLLRYIPITLEIVAISLVLGLLLGVLLALCRLYQVPVLNQFSKFYISFIRGTPINIQLYIIYYGVPALLAGFLARFDYDINRTSPMVFVVIAYMLNNAGFFAELVRAAVSGVEPGQSEAGYSIGLTRIQTFRRIVAPQAIRIAIPDFENMVVNLLKNTSLAYMLGVTDLMAGMQRLTTLTHRSIEGYLATAVIYFVLSTIIEAIFALLQRRRSYAI